MKPVVWLWYFVSRQGTLGGNPDDVIHMQVACCDLLLRLSISNKISSSAPSSLT